MNAKKAVFCCVGGCLNNTKTFSNPVKLERVTDGVVVPVCNRHREGVLAGAGAVLAAVRDLLAPVDRADYAADDRYSRGGTREDL